MAVKLTAAGERNVKNGHPWIFTNSIQKINNNAFCGDIAIIFGRAKNKVIGVGLYDSKSPICIKMIHHGGGVTIDSNFFFNKINEAYANRAPLLKTMTNSYRLLFGENDGFPGLIADIYHKVMVIKLYSSIWFPFLKIITEHLIQVSKITTVVLRLSRSLQQMKNNDHFEDGQVIYGTLTDANIPFIEHGVHFSANVIKGHKTGYFLDHRENRRQVGILSKNKTVLDVFSYAGGFSVHALANQAKEVTSIDISKQALTLAIENGRLNRYSGNHKTLAGDAFKILKNLISKEKTYDVVIIDPPSFAKNKKEIEIAKKKYKQLALLGASLTSRNGLLVLASCSSRVLASEFLAINKEVLDRFPRNYLLVNTTQHDIDHPVNFREGAYLKTGYYRFSD